VTKIFNDQGFILICPDLSKDLYLYQNYETPDYAAMQVEIFANYENEKDKTKVREEVSNFVVGRQ
jgi:hypothetical protein